MIDRLWEKHAVQVMLVGWTIGTVIDVAILVVLIRAVR